MMLIGSAELICLRDWIRSVVFGSAVSNIFWSMSKSENSQSGVFRDEEFEILFVTNPKVTLKSFGRT